jgi:GH35 family endo-1,4-beta-xylanase
MSSGELRRLADECGFLVGGCFAPDAFAVDPGYGRALAGEMNVLVAENIMKPRFLQPEQGNFNFEAADRMVEFAEAHNMKVRGHALTWHGGIPDWLDSGAFTRPEALNMLRKYVMTVVKHFKGRVFAWDVINELLDGTGIFRESNPWIRFIGPDYVDYVYKWAHQADPDCILFYNDYDMDVVTDKAEYCRRWLGGLLDKGVPIHAVGLQAHLSLEDEAKLEGLPGNIKLFNDMGLTVHITELDVRLPTDATEADFERQANIYRLVFDAALAAKDCPAVVLWGFSDKYSWVPNWKKGLCDHALILDRDYNPKPAYNAICDVLRRASSARR